MAGENVLNFFRQADQNGDNAFVNGGTSETGAGTNLKTIILQGRIPNSTTLSIFNEDDSFIPIPFSGKIISVQVAIKNFPVLDDIVVDIETSQGPVTDSEITFTAGETIAFKESIPTGNNIVSAGDVFEMRFSDTNNTDNVITNLTQLVSAVNSGVATATTFSVHGLTTGQEIEIIGAAESEYNGLFKITVEDTSNFSYLVPTGGASTASGSPFVRSRPIITINFSIVIELD